MGSRWEVTYDLLIPLRDIPLLTYNTESSITSKPDDNDTFSYALKENLTELIQFCSSLKHKTNKRQLGFKKYYRHIPSQILHNNSMDR